MADSQAREADETAIVATPKGLRCTPAEVLRDEAGNEICGTTARFKKITLSPLGIGGKSREMAQKISAQLRLDPDVQRVVFVTDTHWASETTTLMVDVRDGSNDAVVYHIDITYSKKLIHY